MWVDPEKQALVASHEKRIESTRALFSRISTLYAAWEAWAKRHHQQAHGARSLRSDVGRRADQRDVYRQHQHRPRAHRPLPQRDRRRDRRQDRTCWQDHITYGVPGNLLGICADRAGAPTRKATCRILPTRESTKLSTTGFAGARAADDRPTTLVHTCMVLQIRLRKWGSRCGRAARPRMPWPGSGLRPCPAPRCRAPSFSRSTPLSRVF
jgi:hypothetical protein